METKKSKVFTRKVIALFLAVLMAATTLTGALTAFATKSLSYHDNALYSNAVAWVEASSDQTCEALLDTADDFIQGLDVDLKTIAGGALGSGKHVNADYTVISLEGYIDDLDGVLDLLVTALPKITSGLAGSVVGDLGDLKITAITGMNSPSTKTADVTSQCGNSYRATNNAKDIILRVIQFLYDNSNSSDTVLYKFLNGNLSIGSIIEGIIGDDIYGLLQGMLGAEDGYQNDLVYNLLRPLIVNNVGAYEGKTPSSWNYDDQLFGTILPYYLNKLSFEITYPERVNYTTDGHGYKVYDEETKSYIDKTGWDNDSSKRRYLEMQDYIANNGGTMVDAAIHYGYDTNLAYSTEEGYEGNVLITQYAGNQISISKSQNLYDIVWKALPIVWKTALQPTLNLVHVNYNGGESSEGSVGSNYDNHYYYWYIEQGYTWDRTNWQNNYDKVQDWADDVWESYNTEENPTAVSSASDFLKKVEATLSYDRYAKNDKYNWRDIEASKLFNEIRFSPLAAAHFHIHTGPLNLYFEQTGASNIEEFMNSHINSSNYQFTGYTGIVEALNDFAVAAMADFFPNNQYVGETTNNKGAFTHTSLGTSSSDTYTIENTGTGATVNAVIAKLMENAAKVFQFAADATDANILNPYYHNFQNDNKVAITEENIEDAIIPFAISALKNWNITASIHNSDWDKVKDVEGLAVVGLKEYLNYLFPDRDYEAKGLWAYDSNGYIVAASGTTLLDKAIVPMAADAVGFVLTAAGVPFFTNYTFKQYSAGQKPDNLWDPYTMSFTDSGMDAGTDSTGLDNKFFDYLNTVIVYFADYYGIGSLANVSLTSSAGVFNNINTIINEYLPAIGELQQGKSNKHFDSKQLLWNDIVLGVLDIGKTDSTRTNSSAYGFTNILTIAANIITAAPITSYSVEYTVVFSVVKPLINKLFGSRSSTTRNIISVSESNTTPVDTFLKKAQLIPAVQNLVYNIYEAFSISSYSTSGLTSAKAWKALCSILQFTQLVPKLRDNTIGGVSGTIADPVQSGVNNNGNINNTTLTLRNESWGLNQFYKDSTGTIREAGRYYANNIQSITVTDSAGRNVTSQFTITSPTGSLDPEQKEVLDVSGRPATSNQLFTFTITYGMSRKDNLANSSYDFSGTGYTAKAYMYVTSGDATDEAWDSVYGTGVVKGMSDVNVAAPGEDNGITTTTSNSNAANVTIPDLLIFKANSGANTSGYSYRVTNKASNVNKTVQSQYAYVAAGTTYIEDGSEVTSDSDNTELAFAAVDKDGNVLDPTGEIVMTSEEAIESGMPYTVNSDGVLEALIVPADDVIEGSYKAGTPLAGVYIHETTNETVPYYVEADAEKEITGEYGYRHYAIFDNDGQALSEGIYKMGLSVKVSNTNYNSPITLAVGDYESKYSEYKSLADGYDNYYSSFTDYSSSLKTAIAAAKSRTVFNGVNIGNLSDAVNMETYIDELKEEAADVVTSGTDYAAYIHDEVSVPRRFMSNVDYKITANYEKAVDFSQAAEALLIGTAVTDIDDKGETVPVYDEDGYPTYTYTSNATKIQLQEAARLAKQDGGVYWNYVERRAYIGDLAEEEVVHATSKVDEYDDVIDETKTSLSNFGYEADSSRTSPYRFYLSVKDENELDNVKAYKVSVTGSPTLRFGKIDSKGYLANDGYETALWNCYVDALGETLNAIATQGTVSQTYDAKSHLVMAENALLLAAQEDEEPSGEGVHITGRIIIASNVTGTAGIDSDMGGIDGITISDGTNEIVTETVDGYEGVFDGYIAEGTTTLTVSGPAALTRTITLSGNESELTDITIPVLIGDYNGDGKINPTDVGLIYAISSTAAYADISGDNKVTPTDIGTIYKLTTNVYPYAKLSFEA